jgi:SEC-C motif
MVFAIDLQTRRLIASVGQGDGVEEFDCVADTCRNPACRCLTVTVALRARTSSVLEKPVPTLERKVGVDLGTRTIDRSFMNKASQSDIAFAEVLLAAMVPSDFDLLGNLHFMIKSRETEQAKLTEIEAHFDFDEIERSSIMQAYNDILPFAETMQVVVEGIEYVVPDQYCVRPGCGCTDADLNLLPINEGSGALETTGLADVNYESKTWEAVDDEPLPCDVATFRSLMESTIPDLYSKLQARHKKLRTIYSHCHKRARTVIAGSIPQQPVGRNDLCPCGSGKKFKKCCIGKGTRGADARIETTFTIRR